MAALYALKLMGLPPEKGGSLIEERIQSVPTPQRAYDVG
jgi:hypothetical protein